MSDLPPVSLGRTNLRCPDCGGPVEMVGDIRDGVYICVADTDAGERVGCGWRWMP